MARSHNDCTRRPVQDVSAHPRGRLCLLKGCERTFHPPHPLSRYCSAACAAAARRWRQRTANRRYRASAHGKECRREQSRRYRAALRARKVARNTPRDGCEGYPYAATSEIFCCRRPGCYEHFLRRARSPGQKFCSWRCRQALRRVLIRERRWRRKFTRLRLARCRRDDFW